MLNRNFADQIIKNQNELNHIASTIMKKDEESNNVKPAKGKSIGPT